MFQIDSAVYFDMQLAPHVFFSLLGLNLNTLHDLLRVIFRHRVCLSVRPPVSNFSVYDDNSTSTNTISLRNIVIRARL